MKKGQNGEKPPVYHGSTSASLPGVLKHTNSGLLSVHELLKKNEAPFSGALEIYGGGKLEDSNDINVVNCSRTKTALIFSMILLKTWNPDIGEANKQKLISQLSDAHKNTGITLNNGKSYNPNAKRISELLKVEGYRLSIWQTLSEDEQAMIQDQFPVLYEIGSESAKTIQKEGGNEEYVSNKAPLNDLNIFIPNGDRLQQVLKYISSVSTTARIHPISELFTLNNGNLNNLLRNADVEPSFDAEFIKKEIIPAFQQEIRLNFHGENARLDKWGNNTY